MPNFNFASIFLKERAAVFLSLSKTRSFTATSRQMGLSQSSVSRIINELESELGMELMDHTVRPIRFTAEGTALQKFLSSETQYIDTYLQGLRDKNALKPRLRLGVVESIARILSQRIVSALMPDCSQISVMTGIAGYLLRRLDEDQLDVIICSDPFANRNDLRRTFLFREPSVIIAPDSLRLPNAPSWQDLQYCGLPIIQYNRNNSGGQLQQKLFNRLGLNFINKLEVDINALLLTFVSDGMGWALTRPTTLVQHPELISKVRVYRMPDPVAAREIYVITRLGELEELAARVTEIAADGIWNLIIPEIIRKAPWCADYMFAAADKTGVRKPVGKGIGSRLLVL
ncbi:LysR family transcriptional regulator [Mesosutterella sp. AGMB02718]|uniref:LysR family transcriptional regulator n=1 Tax=Mesosutterella faecium TaxID=2925194 RepID=A0ABT7IM16_9BURK|nr:LysR family transcriptional regulator [Mesosutterella sp. AGMB02718]MDL2059411.1 LysR family transcriptional regulator [Mesosutterella sp. AGMB02718]